jgi:hypothetical protein
MNQTQISGPSALNLVENVTELSRLPHNHVETKQSPKMASC